MGKTELNSPKLKKFTEADFIKLLELYKIYAQSDERDRMIELIAPTALGYPTFLRKLNIDKLKMTSDGEFIEIMNKKFEDIRRFYSFSL